MLNETPLVRRDAGYKNRGESGDIEVEKEGENEREKKDLRRNRILDC